MPREKAKKTFMGLSDIQKKKVAREFDSPLPSARFKPLNRKQRLLWDCARSSHPDVSIYVHEGQTDIVIHLDPQLMAQAQAFAVKRRTTLPKMIDRGLRGLLAFEA